MNTRLPLFVLSAVGIFIIGNGFIFAETIDESSIDDVMPIGETADNEETFTENIEGENDILDYGNNEDGIKYEGVDVDEDTRENIEYLLINGLIDNLEDIENLYETKEKQESEKLEESESLFAFIIAGVLFIYAISAGCEVFKKAGEKGWKFLIPVLNVYVWFKIVGMKNWLWCLLGTIIGFALLVGVIPFVEFATPLVLLFGACVIVSAVYKMPRKFGWGVASSIFFLILAPIAIFFLGYGKNEYKK